MAVGPTSAESVNSSSASLTTVSRPRGDFSRNNDIIKVNLWVWMAEMHLRRYQTILKTENNLDDRGQSGGGFKMADIALY